MQWEYSRYEDACPVLAVTKPLVCLYFCLFVCFLLSACRVVRPGPAEGGGPASAEAVCHSSCPAAVHQLPEPELVTLTDLETDEATHAGRVDWTVLLANYLRFGSSLCC